MLPGTSLFVALQTNTLQDMGGGYVENWSQMIQDLQMKMDQQHQFFCPKLEINFRNTSSIFETANRLEKVEGITNVRVQNTLGIPTMGTTLEEGQVNKINFNWNPRDKKPADLHGALAYLFERLEKDIDLKNDPFVIMFDDTTFTMDDVYDGVKSALNATNAYRYPCTSDSDPEKEIQNFLSNPHGILITTHGLFKGAEAETVISLQRSNVTSSNLRGTLLRAVSRLYILMGIAEHEYYESKTTINDDSLLYCFQKYHEYAWECLNCSDIFNRTMTVCTPCKKVCHGNHVTAGRGVQKYRLDKICQCVCFHK